MRRHTNEVTIMLQDFLATASYQTKAIRHYSVADVFEIVDEEGHRFEIQVKELNT